MTTRNFRIAAAIIAASSIFTLQSCSLGGKKVTAGTEIITTVFVVGEATITGSGSPEKLTTGKVITKNDIIKTGPKSSVVVQVGNLSTLRINENAEFSFLSFRENGATELNLKRGEVFSKVLKLSKDEQYKVKTPVCVAAVRGTQFLVSAEAKKSSVKVLDGKVAVKSAEGKQEEKVAEKNIGVEVAAADAAPVARNLEEVETLTLEKYSLYQYDEKLDGKNTEELKKQEEALLKKEAEIEQKIQKVIADEAILSPVEKLRKKGKPLTMLYLRDGSQIVGSVVSADGANLTLDTGDGSIRIPTNEIIRRVITK